MVWKKTWPVLNDAVRGLALSSQCHPIDIISEWRHSRYWLSARYLGRNIAVGGPVIRFNPRKQSSTISSFTISTKRRRLTDGDKSIMQALMPVQGSWNTLSQLVLSFWRRNNRATTSPINHEIKHTVRVHKETFTLAGLVPDETRYTMWFFIMNNRQRIEHSHSRLSGSGDWSEE